MSDTIQKAIEASREDKEDPAQPLAVVAGLMLAGRRAQREHRFREALAVAVSQVSFQKCYCDERRQYQPFSPCSRCTALARIAEILEGKP